MIGQRGDHARLLVTPRGRVRWRVKRGRLVAFSPDGVRVLAAHRGGRLSVLTARDGHRVTAVELPAGAQPWSLEWESNRALLTVVHDPDGREGLARIRLDGGMERAAPALPPREPYRPPYVLLDRP